MLQSAASTAPAERHPRDASPEPNGTLSPRQREVLELLADGVAARRIAAQLGLAEPTVRNHIRAILRKLDCHSQLEAVATAYRIGLLERPDAGTSRASGLRGSESPPAAQS